MLSNTHQFSVYARRTAQGLGLRLTDKDGLATVVGFSPIYFQNNNFLMADESIPMRDQTLTVDVSGRVGSTAAAAAPDHVSASVPTNETLESNANEIVLAAASSSVTNDVTDATANSSSVRIVNPIQVDDVILAVNNVDAYTHTFQEVTTIEYVVVHTLTSN